MQGRSSAALIPLPPLSRGGLLPLGAGAAAGGAAKTILRKVRVLGSRLAGAGAGRAAGGWGAAAAEGVLPGSGDGVGVAVLAEAGGVDGEVPARGAGLPLPAQAPASRSAPTI